jgi:hypothetical protein
MDKTAQAESNFLHDAPSRCRAHTVPAWSGALKAHPKLVPGARLKTGIAGFQPQSPGDLFA